MFRMKSRLCAVVVSSAASLAGVAAAPTGPGSVDKLLDISAEIEKVATADRVEVTMVPADRAYAAALDAEGLKKVGCVYVSGPPGNGAITAMLDIFRQGITSYHGVPHAFPPPDLRFEVDFMRGDRLLGSYFFADNYGGSHPVDGIFPSGWGTAAADVPARLRAWAKRPDVRRADAASQGCTGT
jgi:hypothetical protein